MGKQGISVKPALTDQPSIDSRGEFNKEIDAEIGNQEKYADRPGLPLPRYLQGAFCPACRFYHPGRTCNDRK